MNIESRPPVDERNQAALDDLKGVIRRRYPEAKFDVARGDDPEGIYLRATLDVDDVDEVLDQEVLDCLFDVQVERDLPIYLISLQPVERVLAEMAKHPQRRSFSPSGEGSRLREDHPGMAQL